VIARITRYRTPPDALGGLFEEIVTLARSRSRSRVRDRTRRAEVFFVNTSTGDGLLLLLGDRRAQPVLELERTPIDRPEEYEVRLLQIGGPRDSGVVEALYARVVRCDRDTAGDASFDWDAVPRSSEVWARAVLTSPDGRLLAFAVATDRSALEQALARFSARCTQVDDYDEVAYHFFFDGPRTQLD
jgi:hypothetical protein